jgi:hypothetical protein
MTDFHTGWAPAGRIRRPVALPERLDQKVGVLANQKHLSPAAYVSELLNNAVSTKVYTLRPATLVNNQSELVNGRPERRVQRIVALDRSVYSALNNYIVNSEFAFSDLAAAIIGQAVEHGGNGNGNGNLPSSED